MLKKIAAVNQKLNPKLRQIIGNMGWLFSEKLLQMGVGLVVGVWVARYLGPEQFGLFNYAIAFVSMFSPLVTLGLDSIAVREIVRDPSCKNKILGTVFSLKLIGGMMILLLAVGIISLLRADEDITRWLVGIIAAGTIFQAFQTIDFWFQSQVQSKYTVIAKNIAYVIVSIIRIILLQTKAPLIAFAWIKLAEMVLGAVGLVIAYRIQGNNIAEWRASLTLSKILLRDSWPLALSSLAIYIQARIDQVMIGLMIGDGEVGQYSVAIRLIEMLAFVPMIIRNSSAPAIAKAKITGEDLYNKRLINLYRLMFIIFIMTATPIFLFSQGIIGILYGEKYLDAGVLMSWSAIRLLFAGFGVIRSLFMINNDMSQNLLISSVSGSIVNVCLNYILIPKYAAIGAIWATIASLSTTVFFTDLFYPSARKNLKLMLLAIITPWQINLR